MSHQLSLFNAGSDNDLVSLPEISSDTSITDTAAHKRQAIQRFLNNGKPEPIACVNTYSPGGRATEYYRLSFNWRGKKKHIHICGGSTIAELATYRAKKLQAMIDRGAELAEVIAAVQTFNSGG